MSAKLNPKSPDTDAAPPLDGARSYGQDVYSWAMGQEEALRARHVGELDWDHLAEEIGDLGREIFSSLRSSFRVVLTHMLKWDHQPERRSRSWVNSIRTHRNDIADILAENPSLRRRQLEALLGAYKNALIDAAEQMKRPERSLPGECPYELAEVMGRTFDWPQG